MGNDGWKFSVAIGTQYWFSFFFSQLLFKFSVLSCYLSWTLPSTVISSSSFMNDASTYDTTINGLFPKLLLQAICSQIQLAVVIRQQLIRNLNLWM